MKLRHGQAVALMVLVTAMWSIAGAVTRQLEAARSFEVTFWRSLFTLISLLLILPLWQGRGVWRQIPWRSRYFWRMTPIGFFSYGGMVAIQTLWAGPWMTQVAGWTPLESATGLFAINLSMLTSFWLWGWITPGLARRGIHADALIAKGFPLSLLEIGRASCRERVSSPV